MVVSFLSAVETLMGGRSQRKVGSLQRYLNIVEAPGLDGTS